MRFIFQTIFYFFMYVEVSAQTAISVFWNMQTLLPTTSLGANFQASEISVGNNYGNTQLLSGSSSSLGGYIGASGEQNAAIAARTGPLDKSLNGSAFLSITLTASPGYKLTISSFSLGIRSTTTGPQHLALFSSMDDFQAPLLTNVLLANSEWSYFDFPLPTSPSKSVIVFKLFGYGGVGNAAINIANWRLDDLQIQGIVLPESLPLKWQNFLAYPVASTIKLVWSTNEEYNNSGFTVCRSTDGVVFRKLGFVPSTSNQSLSTSNQYQFVDSFPHPGLAFYKIQQIDVDSSRTESPIRTVQWVSDKIFENSVNSLSFHESDVYFKYMFMGKATFCVYTIFGQLLGRATYYSSTQTSTLIHVSCSSAIGRAGVYLFVIENEGKLEIKKIGRIN